MRAPDNDEVVCAMVIWDLLAVDYLFVLLECQCLFEPIALVIFIFTRKIDEVDRDVIWR